MDFSNELNTDAAKILFKKRLLDACLSILKARMENSAALVENAQRASNSEEKSSAGDKYETSRAMSHLEKDMYAKQLQQTRLELSILMETDCDRLYNEVRKGSIIDCGQIIFFMAAGIGKLEFEHTKIVVLSPLAPMGRLLAGKTRGGEVIFNERRLTIHSVF